MKVRAFVAACVHDAVEPPADEVLSRTIPSIAPRHDEHPYLGARRHWWSFGTWHGC